MSSFSLSLFQSSLMFTVPLSIAATFALIFIPSLLVSGSKPENISRAINCYLLKTFAVFMIAFTAVVFIRSLLMMKLPENNTLTALALLFVIGVGILVQQSTRVATIDEASSVIPRLIFTHTCEVVGALIALLAGISLVVTFMVTKGFAGWEMSATMLLLGTTLMLLSSIHLKKRQKSMLSFLKKRKK